MRKKKGKIIGKKQYCIVLTKENFPLTFLVNNKKTKIENTDNIRLNILIPATEITPNIDPNIARKA
jgi:hypothetical protein